MPIFRIGSKIAFFAHVPKCAGTSIEHFLKAHFAPLAFHDNMAMAQPQDSRWSRTSPQHIDASSLARLFPRDLEGQIPSDMEFDIWISELSKTMISNPWVFDNHTRPMTEMVPEGATVFKLEDGLEIFLDWLQETAGADVILPREIAPRNVLSQRLIFEEKPDHPVQPSAEAIAQIQRMYGDDFARFGYGPDKDELGI